MELTKELKEVGMYEVSQETKEIDMTLTDRDIVMGDIAAKTVISNEKKPELVVAGSHIGGDTGHLSLDTCLQCRKSPNFPFTTLVTTNRTTTQAGVPGTASLGRVSRSQSSLS